MAENHRKTIEQLMKEVIWTRKEAARVLRIDPRTLDRYLFHPDPKKRLPCLRIGNTVKVERKRLMEYFRLFGSVSPPYSQVVSPK